MTSVPGGQAIPESGADQPAPSITSERVILWVTPERRTIIDQNEDTSE